MTVQFCPTHVIEIAGRRIKVMLVDGAAYTQAEWLTDAPADWEVVDGEWLFQGRVPAAPYTVERL